MKRKIGISYSKSNFQNYWNWFGPEDLKDDIELIELSFQRNNVEDIYRCDGFILTGGGDIEPSLYGGPSEYPNRPEAFEPERDYFEKLIYQYSQLQRLPLLGVCRGLQYVNVLEGGSLFADMGENANQIHKKDNSEDKQHPVNIQKDTLLYTITGLESGIVNSAHHQSVDPHALGNNLQASAFSDTPDATVEGLEFKDKTGKAFMLCVQWHPERMPGKEESPLSGKIKEKFLEEIRSATEKS